MITTNPANLAEFNRSLVSRFKRGVGRIEPQYTAIASVETSTTSQTLYGFLERISGLREWVGDRVAEDLKSYDFAIKNRHFEKTLRVNRDHLEDDQFGFYGTQAEDLGEAAARHPDQLVATLLEAGFTTLCYDGQYFFDTDHPYSGGPASTTTQSNKGTTALSATSYAVARAQMMALKDDGGEIHGHPAGPAHRAACPGGDGPRNPQFRPHLHGGRSLEQSLEGLGESPRDAPPARCQQLVSPRIPSTRSRASSCNSASGPKLVSLLSSNDQNVFRRNELLWGIDYRGEAGYSLWQLMFGAAVA